MIRVILPAHLRTLAGVPGELTLEVRAPASPDSIIDALESRYPMLRGTIRDQTTQRRRPFIRFFAGGADLSNDPANRLLPEAVATGAEPFLIVGAIAGG